MYVFEILLIYILIMTILIMTMYEIFFMQWPYSSTVQMQ